ncbi:carbohydrate ABC transporter permease [Catenuloplanes atrovinosus]|uniref:Multiple sugar transport system permease protein n=1 Tax=Catenuloplanes atrovinosus TaxID=137266 RepID=A0AAE3YJ51_9ACTN|nr:carbohydrate ABC transporter permease [Catenuloplanes atrovinosus]MDR7273226.1 multiple sugar transport system permease protein [Catenuloplanes atrovinosus]
MTRLRGELLRLPLYLAGLTMLVPFYWMASAAFKPVPELTRNPPSFVPGDPTLDAFYEPAWDPGVRADQLVAGLFQRYQDVPGGFLRFMGNSLFVAAAITVLSLLIAALAAYALTKMDLPGRRVIFVVVVASMMIPWQVTLVPNYLIVRNLEWLNTYQGYIVPALAKAFVVFFLVQYMRSIPDDLVHAARVDGAGEFRIWWRVVMPLMRPALAAMAIFVVLAEWNNFLWPLIIVQDDTMANVPVALSRLNASNAFNPHNMAVIMAASLLTSLPTVIFFLAFQKHFTRGIALSGIKG